MGKIWPRRSQIASKPFFIFKLFWGRAPKPRPHSRFWRNAKSGVGQGVAIMSCFLVDSSLRVLRMNERTTENKGLLKESTISDAMKKLFSKKLENST